MRRQRAFPYYGSKTRLGPLYPSPAHGLIIEPFAGAAAYSQRYWECDVQLFDLDQRVVDCWNFLIEASAKDVLSLPLVSHGLDLTTLGLDAGAEALLSFYSYDGLAGTKNRRVGKRCGWNKARAWLAGRVGRYSHWKCSRASYADAPALAGTWFVDPPYVAGGEHYDHGNTAIDYEALSAFCRSRQGQVIVCENSEADWLPFTPLAEHKGVSNKITTEVVWISP